MRSALVVLLLALSALHLAAQTTEYAFRQFGGQTVSDAELVQIAALVTGTGQRPWLIHAPRSISLTVRAASLFLEPDVADGRMHRLVADGPPSGPAQSSWRIRDSHPYAYVPGAGLRPGELTGDGDISWPFILDGEFDDDTVISLVAFIRTQPPIPVPAFLRNVPAAPITGIKRDGDAVVVGFRTSESTGSSVWLVRKDGRWVISRSESAIA